MKRLLVLSFVLLAACSMIIVGCSSDNENSNLLANDNSNPNGVAQYSGPPRLTMTFFDKPAPDGIEHLYLHVVKVGVHHEDSGWMYNDVDTTIDFLELVNGVTVTLFDDTIPEGYYSQMRMVLGEGNEIVVDSVTYPLTVPSGMQTGVKLNFDFEIHQDEFIHLYVDFDVSKSVLSTGNGFKLKPTYRVFKEDISATLAGMVTDGSGLPVFNALVEANSMEYSTATYTDSTGAYMFILPQGTYDIAAVPDSGYLVDTMYAGVVLNAGDALMGFDFVFTEEIVVTNGVISGMVTDTLGNPVIGTMVDINSSGFSGFAWTDSTGMYVFDVLADTYDISITPDSGSVVDTMYMGVLLAAGDTLSGFDFVISDEVIIIPTGPGYITGSVLDTLGAAFPVMMVSAISGTDTTLTMTDASGNYMFTLDPGTYDLFALPSIGMAADTSYIGVMLNSNDTLSGYNFIVQ
ncbi:MAG: DUF4382 domain-containing protein [Calditrichaeota bacterium]|nr:MAG: DUF4382 domain-containing protein [Calditrichota bacterium]